MEVSRYKEWKVLSRSFIVEFVLLPLIGALHGWLTNVIALRLLFRPANEINILGLRIQGLLPKRKLEIAESIGEIVELELLRMDDIKAQLQQGETLEYLSRSISRAARESLAAKLPKFLPPGLRETIIAFLEQRLSIEVRAVLERFLNDSSHDDMLQGRVKSLVTSRINAFDIGKMEAVTKQAVGRELKAIEYLGFVMGLFIGIIQGLFLLVLLLTGLY
jgi:uncharacterized membrane protein YheB (UPF0754 family)